MNTYPTLDAVSVNGRRVFLRVDFNVPLLDGEVRDTSRIDAALPTINHILSAGGRLVIASHLGRPSDGAFDASLSLEPVAKVLAARLERGEVTLTDSCVGDGAKRVVQNLRDGDVALLENLRFHAGEKDNDEVFAKELASVVDVYVNDAFGAMHRRHASVHALPKLMRECCLGLLVEQEIAALDKIRQSPERPYWAVVGGAKVSDKLDILETLLTTVDGLLIGGAMANTFLAATGSELGKSLVEETMLSTARTLIQRAAKRDVPLLFPTDLRVGTSVDATDGQVVPLDGVPEHMMALDMGPDTVTTYRSRLAHAKTVFWNGPMGLFENAIFSEGTKGVARAIADCSAFSVVGGGDSLAAVRALELAPSFTHLSTGGGASLTYLKNGTLPGLEVLR